MQIKRKNPLIWGWWLASENSKLIFEDLPLSKDDSRKKIVVVGFKKREYIMDTFEIISSGDYVKKVTKKGVLTSQGEFYKFDDAHGLYLQFLAEIRKQHSIIAINWRYDNCSNTLYADIIKNNIQIKNLSFDFKPDITEILFSGYSNELNSRIILSPFAYKSKVDTLDAIIPDAYNSLFLENEERKTLVNKIISKTNK